MSQWNNFVKVYFILNEKQSESGLFQLSNDYLPPSFFSHEYIFAQSGKINEFSPLIEIITDRDTDRPSGNPVEKDHLFCVSMSYSSLLQSFA